MNKCLTVCLRISRAIPLIIIMLIIGWSYYAYVVAMCIYAIPTTNIGEKVALIILYHIFLGMFLWAYLQTAITKPALVPSEFKLTPADLANTETPTDAEAAAAAAAAASRREFLAALVRQRALPVCTRGADGGVRVCDTCLVVKPDRAHHCSTCGVCLLKMDHHCPWVNNCVGLHNYKYFLLFLLYGALYCCFVGGSSTKYFVTFWTEGLTNVQAHRFNVLFLFFAAWLFFLSLAFLAGYHAFLTLRNRTTIESSRPPVFATTAGGSEPRAYDLGAGANFRQVFGNRRRLWPLPLLSWRTDGINWELRDSASAATGQTYVSTGPSMLLSNFHYRPDVDLERGG